MKNVKFTLILMTAISGTYLQSCGSTEGTNSSMQATVDIFDPSGHQSYVTKFFENYGLIPQKGFDAFKAQQKLLLANNMTTDVLIKSQKKTYSGPEGYFASLADWGAVFTTGEDFYHNVYGGPRNIVYARLHGTLQMKESTGAVKTIEDRGHCWTETFVFDNNSKIQKLIVDMKIGVKCLDSGLISTGAR